jgi:hypothetical protein
LAAHGRFFELVRIVVTRLGISSSSPRIFFVAQLAPKMQGWCQFAMPWAADISGVPRVPERTRSSK